MNARNNIKNGCILIFLIMLTSFELKKPSAFIKEINKNYVQVKPGLFISRYEVSNRQFRQYQESLIVSGQEERYQRSRLDTFKWSELLKNFTPFTVYYHSHAAYDNYPVVTCRYDAAIDFCSWLTETYNNDPTRKFKKVVFRLPTEEEWLFASTGGDTNKVFAFKGAELKGKDGRYKANFTIGTSPGTVDKPGTVKQRLITSPVKSFEPNESGIFNMSGNVAEMTSLEGIAKGGSYMDDSEGIKVKSRKSYDHSSAEVGFRPVMEIAEE